MVEDTQLYHTTATITLAHRWYSVMYQTNPVVYDGSNLHDCTNAFAEAFAGMRPIAIAILSLPSPSPSRFFHPLQISSNVWEQDAAILLFIRCVEYSVSVHDDVSITQQLALAPQFFFYANHTSASLLQFLFTLHTSSAAKDAVIVILRNLSLC